MHARRYKRRQYIVDPAFQYRLIRRFSVLALLMIAMSIGFLVLVYILHGDIQFELAQPDPFSQAGQGEPLVVRKTLLGLLWPILAICLGIALATTFLFGVLISHRMAGPVFRIRRVLGDMRDGDLRGDIRLRKRDDFKKLAESINEVKQSWRESVAGLRRIRADLGSADADQRAEGLRKMEQALARFQI